LFLNSYLFYVSARYDDEEKGCNVWDPTTHNIFINKYIVCMEQPEGLVKNCNGRFVCMLKNSLYGLMVPKQLYKRFESFMVSQKFSRGKYDYTIYSTFTILTLYIDDMIVASRSMVEISEIKAHLEMTFQMKDQGATKQILSGEVHIDDNNGNLWLQFIMNVVKLVDIPIAFHYKFSSISIPIYKEEKVMSRVNLVGGLLHTMNWFRPDISHLMDVANTWKF
jgi:hypothetical protein